jgi:hypothetical protein
LQVASQIVAEVAVETHVEGVVVQVFSDCILCRSVESSCWRLAIFCADDENEAGVVFGVKVDVKGVVEVKVGIGVENEGGIEVGVAVVANVTVGVEVENVDRVEVANEVEVGIKDEVADEVEERVEVEVGVGNEVGVEDEGLQMV